MTPDSTHPDGTPPEARTNEAFHFSIRIPVLWGDQDSFGHVNNARYFTWFEAARLEYFKALGLATGGTPKVGPILAQTACDFVAPVHWPGEVEVGARTLEVGRTSFTMEYAVWTAGAPQQLRARGRGVLVLIDYETGAKVPVDDALRARLLET